VAISIDDVHHIARLARLGVSDERADSLVRELNTILAHMDVLSRVDTTGIAEVSGVGAAGLPLRPDTGPQIPLARAREDFAPRMKDGFFLVPRLATHDDASES
jgi:aspartyl-tRNA(Asn)/glutamyl-tRNA(Gln) amidotransferase subunit C